jgi:hypothetical protein
MNIIKSSLLGPPAGLLLMSGAQAAKPVEYVQAAKPIEYVKVCSGAGFYYIPGTDTCIRNVPVPEIRSR